MDCFAFPCMFLCSRCQRSTAQTAIFRDFCWLGGIANTITAVFGGGIGFAITKAMVVNTLTREVGGTA